MIIEMSTADMKKAAKSIKALLKGPAGLPNSDGMDAVKIGWSLDDTALYMMAGGRYAIGVVRLPAKRITFDSAGYVWVDGDELVDALESFPPRALVDLSVGNVVTGPMVFKDGESTRANVEAVPNSQTWASPIDPLHLEYPGMPLPDQGDSAGPSRFTIAPRIVNLLSSVAWSNADGMLFEPGETPNAPVLVRIGGYALVYLPPLDSRPPKSAARPPDEERFRWNNVLRDLDMVRRLR